MHNACMLVGDHTAHLVCDTQVRRLIRVLSVKGIRSCNLLEVAQDSFTEQLSTEDRQILQSCGWVGGSGISGLINFAGRSCNAASDSGADRHASLYANCSMAKLDILLYVI